MNEIKLLYTIGDSWTYGDELENPKKECWPSVLSKELGCELVNDAQCGGPNDWMFRRTIEWVCQQKSFDDTAVIVGWSEPNRREEDYNTILQGEGMWEQVMKYLYNDELAHYKSICYMISLQEIFKSKNIKYLFFQPWFDIVSCEERLEKVRVNKSKFSNWLDNEAKEFYPEKLGIGDIIKNLDKKYIIDPQMLDERRNIKSKMILNSYGHPNKNEHILIATFIKEKLLEI